MSSFLAKLKNPLVLGYAVVVLLLLAGAIYVTMMYLNTKDQEPVADSKPKIAAPAAVQKGLKSANTSAQKAYNLHNNAQQAVNEQQVKLSE